MAASHSLRQRTRPVFRAGFFRRYADVEMRILPAPQKTASALTCAKNDVSGPRTRSELQLERAARERLRIAFARLHHRRPAGLGVRRERRLQLLLRGSEIGIFDAARARLAPLRDTLPIMTQRIGGDADTGLVRSVELLAGFALRDRRCRDRERQDPARRGAYRGQHARANARCPAEFSGFYRVPVTARADGPAAFEVSRSALSG